MTTFFYNIFNFQEDILSETLIKPHLVHDALNENSFNYIILTQWKLISIKPQI